MVQFTLFCFTCMLLSAPLFAQAPWTAVTVPETEEAAAVTLLETRQIPVVSWSNAMVEVSAFEGLETVEVAHLEDRLLPQDPRWDPWLRELGAWFRPQGGQVKVWVPSDKAVLAADVLGHPGAAANSPSKTAISAPLITGWTVLSLTLVYAGLRLLAGWRFGWPSLREARRWAWIPVCLVLLFAGIAVTGRGSAAAVKPPSSSALAWVQHRWFQETWPWGARWDDYQPGAVWSFPSYERRNGRLTEISTALTAGTEAWKTALPGTLDPHHAVRIFGSFLP